VAGRSRRDATLLFAYGTLLRPDLLAGVVGAAASWRYAGPAAVRGALYDAGGYPGLCVDGRCRDLVPGMLIELDAGAAALRRLDAYEEVASGLFARRRCLARASDGSARRAWVYVFARPVRGMRRIARWAQ
jgi:gamma-glutamylcyclotransferase (GGCT)/AIG2-like uncharacterized protein YtfP